MRKARLVDCNAAFVRWDGRESGAEFGAADAVWFECPEGHDTCSHTVPFTPALDGKALSSPQSNGAHWKRLAGETIETLTLDPSIRNTCGICKHRGQNLACGGCHFHGYIKNGQIEFCGDSR